MEEQQGSELMRQVGARIRDARKAKGMTLKELGALVGYAQNSLSRWEAGGQPLTVDQLTRLSSALGRPLQYFLGIDFAGADTSRALDLMREAKRRLDELMVEAATPELPGLLGDVVEAARVLSEEKQRQLVEYARFLAGGER